MDKLITLCIALVFTVFFAAMFLDGAHSRTVLHACQIAAIEARYPSADAALICNLK